MFDLILRVAHEDARIRAVYMNGSRTNPNVPKDLFQDYDIVYVSTQTRPFVEDPHWIDRFGERLYLQRPDEVDCWNDGSVPDYDAGFTWLIQFRDGNRLDLHIEPLERTAVLDDKLCVVLLDKDGILPQLPEPTDRDYWVKRPTQRQFWAACNEFWWCMNNVAKGLWRGEIPYVQDMLNLYVRPELVRLLSWEAGLQTGFTCSVGKSGKYLYRWLPAETWRAFLGTYAGGTVDALWDAALSMCALFDREARRAADALGFAYREQEADASFAHLRHVHALPRDAAEIYPG